MDMIQHYGYDFPSEIIDSQYGKIGYDIWLELEAKRINKDPKRTAIVHNNLNKKALWVNNMVVYDKDKPKFKKYEELV